MACFIAPSRRAVKRGRAVGSEIPALSPCSRGDTEIPPRMRERRHQTAATQPANRRDTTMNTMKTNLRPETDLAARYNPVAIRAVVAAALQIKVRKIGGK